MNRIIKIMLAAATLLLLCGCTILTGDDLLQAPKPTKNYTALQTELERNLSAGAVYTSPASGQNRNTVQLKDLDGDGEEEAVALFRESSTSNKFIVYVYKKVGDAYLQLGSISGSGTAIESIDYPVLTADGTRGIVVAWQLGGDGTTGLSMATIQNKRLIPLLETEYTSFKLLDLDKDGADELVTVTIDVQGKKSARMYDYADAKMVSVGEAALSVDTKSIVRVQSGYALDRQAAVFVEEKNESGVGLMTDVFIYQDGSFRNCAQESEQNQGFSTYRPVSVYATDINGDGMMDIPRAKLTPGYSSASTDPQYYLEWYTYGADKPQKVKNTYNSQLEEWMLTIPDVWEHQVTVRHETLSTGNTCTSFAQGMPDGTQIPLLKIYYFSGESREYYAQSTGMISLYKSASAIYTAVIPEESGKSTLHLSQGQVQQMFGEITQEWAGE